METVLSAVRKRDCADLAPSLRAATLFRGLDEVELEFLAEGTTRIEAPTGTVLVRTGDPGDRIFYVSEGMVKLVIEGAGGHDKTIELISAGESFGEAVTFLEIPYRVTAVTVEPSTVLAIRAEALFIELDRNPLLARRLLAGISRRLNFLVTEIAGLSLHTSTQRLISYLLRLVPEGTVDGPVPLVLPTSKAELAAHLSLTQEHFSRVLHGLADKHLITIDGRRITVPDLDRLREEGHRGRAPRRAA
jgi:CRP/FNR family transcriptional regulator, dissimilatory nitrate respiration regulator